jgi:4-amino-4-deoxy-L-arabinose transferase-like glycosyltransferase
LRLYQLNATEFDEDQAMVFRMARDAVVHGLLPATSNIASIRIVNPPGVIYLLMLPAAFSADPLWGAVFVALLNVLAVVLTYFFVRRYFGRLAAVVAGMFYATAYNSVLFSRFIWQQNMIAPFVVLFFFALFWGVVDRRKGWLFPALFLLGLLVQLHETTILLAIPLALAVVLAPETVRWRDLAFGLVSLVLIFFTYLLWEISTKFFDITVILNVSKLPSHIDNVAITFYRDFFSPYDQLPTNTQTLLYQLIPVLFWLRLFTLILVVCGFATVIIGIALSFSRFSAARDATAEHEALSRISQICAGWTHFWRRWTNFRAAPVRCGLILLLAWQIVPLLFLSRHAVPLYQYYLLMLIPGPFILIGLFIDRSTAWVQQRGRRWTIARYGIYAFTCLVLIAQVLGTTAGLIDEVSGNNKHGLSYNTLGSLQSALSEADRLAQQRHLHHVYVTSDRFTQVSLRYLAEQMQTPTTVFDAAHCLVLPGPASGPAVFLVGPYDQFAFFLLKQYATVTLVDQPSRLGSAPFSLLLVQPTSQSAPGASNQAFAHHLQLLDNQAQSLTYNNRAQLATRWQFLSSQLPVYRTTYTYAITASFNASGSTAPGAQTLCVASSVQAGDQLIATFPMPVNTLIPQSVSITARYIVTHPYDFSVGPIHLENIRDQGSVPVTLQTTSGSERITIKRS